jgi:hypothetical protein
MDRQTRRFILRIGFDERLAARLRDGVIPDATCKVAECLECVSRFFA